MQRIKDMSNNVLRELYGTINEKSFSLHTKGITLLDIAKKLGISPENVNMCLWYLRNKQLIICPEPSFGNIERQLDDVQISSLGIDSIES